MTRLLMMAAAVTLLALPMAAGTATAGDSTGSQNWSGHAADRDRAGERATSALNTLEAKGYTNFSDFRPYGGEFAADVTRNGQRTAVVVDPDDSSIKPMAQSGSSVPLTQSWPH